MGVAAAPRVVSIGDGLDVGIRQFPLGTVDEGSQFASVNKEGFA